VVIENNSVVTGNCKNMLKKSTVFFPETGIKVGAER